MTLKVNDTAGVTTAVEFQVREGSQDGDVFGAWSSSWDSSPASGFHGTYSKSLWVPGGEESGIKYRVTYTDEAGNTQVIGGTHYTAHVDEHVGEITIPIVGGQPDLDTRTWDVSPGYAAVRDVTGDLVLTQAFPVPWGVEITEFRARLYRDDADDACSCVLRRLSDTAVITNVGAPLVASIGGWSTQANTGLSEIVSEPGLYQITTTMNPDNAGLATDARGLYARVTYIRHTAQERY